MTTPELTPSGKPRRPLRPLHGIPDRDKRGREGIIVSALFHLAILVALFLPPVLATTLEYDDSEGKGPGPAGGGGGGTSGSGGDTVTPEKLRFVHVAPIPVAPKTVPTTPPVLPPPKQPEPAKTPEPVVPQPQPTATEPVPTGTTVPTVGTGGGSGNDGTGGNGPGTGGGIGSGNGTGRGSGEGPGTGGNGTGNSRPKVIGLAILPLPVPDRVRPYKMVALFDVDEKGNAKLIAFNPSRDAGYNRRLREMLAEIRFRAGTRADGTPVRDTASVTAEALARP